MVHLPRVLHFSVHSYILETDTNSTCRHSASIIVMLYKWGRGVGEKSVGHDANFSIAKHLRARYLIPQHAQT